MYTLMKKIDDEIYYNINKTPDGKFIAERDTVAIDFDEQYLAMDFLRKLLPEYNIYHTPDGRVFNVLNKYLLIKTPFLIVEV